MKYEVSTSSKAYFGFQQVRELKPLLPTWVCVSGSFLVDKIIHGILEPVSMFNQKKRSIIPRGDLNNLVIKAVSESQYIRKNKCSLQWFFSSFYTIDLPEESTTN